MTTQITLPKDAEGHEIPLDTEYLYKYDGKKQEVLSFTYDKRKDKWEIETNSLITDSTFLYLNKPDNWEKLEEDLNRCIKKSNTCMYFSEYGTCNSCSAYGKGTGVRVCSMKVIKDIENRIRNLRKRDNS